MSSLNNRQGPPPEQLWKSWDRKARKQGFHSTIYSSDGSQYKGEWKNDKKHGKSVVNRIRIQLFISHRIGKGIYVWKSTGDFYEGDFANDTRTGFGTLTVKTADGKTQRQYAGGWKNDKRHVRESKEIIGQMIYQCVTSIEEKQLSVLFVLLYIKTEFMRYQHQVRISLYYFLSDYNK